MKSVRTEMREYQDILAGKEAELIHVLRKRDGIVIEKSADQMDEIQYATERDLAIGNVDRESNLLRQVKAALRRLHDDSFGVCLECESPISPKRLAAVPWASRCITCQQAADQEGRASAGLLGEDLVNAA
jgi:DnaK suppressor protein